MGGHMYTCGWFMLMYGKNHHNIVISLQLNKQFFKKRNPHSHLLLVAQSCPTPCDPMDCSLPGASVHGIFQVRILEWVAISFSKGSSWSGIEPTSSALQACSLLLSQQGSPYSPTYFPAIMCNSSLPPYLLSCTPSSPAILALLLLLKDPQGVFPSRPLCLLCLLPEKIP